MLHTKKNHWGAKFFSSLQKARHSEKLIFCIWLSILILFFISIFYIYQNRYTIYFGLGNRAFGGKIMNHTLYNIDVAEFFLSKANKKETPLEWNNYQLSRIQFIQGDFTSAIYFANEELRLYPDNCRTHYIRGLTYGYLDELDKAIHDFEMFNACFPGSWAGHNDLAWFWFRKGNMNKVISVIEEVTEKGTGIPWVQNTYGVALMNAGRYNDAKKAFESAKQAAEYMTEEDWGRAYPGNNPRIYEKGLTAMRKSIETNIALLQEKMNTKSTDLR